MVKLSVKSGEQKGEGDGSAYGSIEGCDITLEEVASAEPKLHKALVSTWTRRNQGYVRFLVGHH